MKGTSFAVATFLFLLSLLSNGGLLTPTIDAESPTHLSRSRMMLQTPQTPISTSSTDTVLESGQRIERTLEPGETHSYVVNVPAAAQHVQVACAPDDLSLRFVGPDGKDVAGLGPRPKRAMVAPEPGAYRIEVRLPQSSGLPGTTNQPRGRTTYIIELKTVRDAEGSERHRANAEKLVMEAEVQLQSSPDPLGRAQQVSSGQVQAALQKFDEAVAEMQAGHDVEGEAEVWSNIGMMHMLAGDYARWAAAYQRKAELHHSTGNLRGQLGAWSLVSMAYRTAGEFDRALDIEQQSLEAARKGQDTAAQATALASIASLHAQLGNPRRALDYYREALAIASQDPRPTTISSILRGIGQAHEALGSTDEALSSYIRSLNGALPFSNDSLTRIARIYERRGALSQAIDYYSRAIQQPNPMFKGRLIGLTPRLRLGELLVQTGDYDGARTHFEEALREAFPDEYSVLARVGSGFMSLGDRDRAAELLNRARILEERDLLVVASGPENAQPYRLQQVMTHWVNRGVLPLAIYYGKHAVNGWQRIRTRITSFDADTRQLYLASKASVYRELADLLIRVGRLSEAEQVLRLLKEDEYFEFVRRNASAAGGGGTLEFTTPEADWESRYREIADKVTAIGKERGDLAAKKTRTAEENARLAALEADLTTAAQAVQHFLEELAREVGSEGRERVFQLRESQGMMETLRELGRRTVAIYTLVTADRYRAILVTADTQKAIEYPIAAADLNRKVLAFREALQNPRRDPRPMGWELYDILVGPVAKDLKDAQAVTIMWSLDGVLRYLPISALYDGEQYLLSRYQQVVFTPASQSRVKDPPLRHWTGLGLGVTEAHGEFPALPGVGDELRTVIRDRELGGKGVIPGRVFINDKFTSDSMKAALRERYPVVHIASHFQFRPGNELESFLLLGDGNRLTLYDVKRSSNLFSGVELLTLSACDTAKGGEANGNEVEGFAVLAQRQGAKAVVASLWPVADESTQKLMREFYTSRTSRNLSKAEALRRSQLALLRERNGKYTHPFYWAPFILIGNWQ